jgi:hypothetical protein
MEIEAKEVEIHLRGMAHILPAVTSRIEWEGGETG